MNVPVLFIIFRNDIFSGNDAVVLDDDRAVVLAQAGAALCDGLCNVQIIIFLADTAHNDSSVEIVFCVTD